MTSEAFNEDCVTGMGRFPDGFFDLAVVDPPYGINSGAEQGKKGRLNQGAGKLKNRALQKMDCDWDRETPGPEYFAELFRVSRHQVIWGGNYFNLPPTRCVLCWDKCQPWENFSQWEMAWTSLDRPAGLFSFSVTGLKEPKIHPTQKPLDLYKWILVKYGLPLVTGRPLKVLDTHMGSQVCRVAADIIGADFYGFEADPNYFNAGNKWYQERTAQQSLFKF